MKALKRGVCGLYKMLDDQFQDPNAQHKLGYMLFHQKKYDKAVKYFKKTPKAITELAYCYCTGKGTEVDINKAIELYQQALDNGDRSVEYQLKILRNLNGRKILTAESIADINLENINTDEIGAIQISPSINENMSSHTLYSIEDYIKSIKIVNDVILKDIPDNDKENELEIVYGVCENIAKNIEFDDEYENIERETNNSDERKYTRRNLLGCLDKKMLCAGISELTRNVLLSKNIDCIFVGAIEHVFNIVKIDDKWYYLDLTFDLEKFKNESEPQFFLVSKDELNKDHNLMHIPELGQVVEEAKESYDRDKISDIRERRRREKEFISPKIALKNAMLSDIDASDVNLQRRNYNDLEITKEDLTVDD